MKAAARQGPVQLMVAPGPLAASALPRLAGMAASRADLPIDRVEDAIAVAELIADNAAAEITGDRIEVMLDIWPGSVMMHVGPLEPGGAQRLAACSDRSGARGPISSLASVRRSAAAAGFERLEIEVIG